MSLPPSSAASPPPLCAIADTFGLCSAEEYFPLLAICFVLILNFIVVNFFRSRCVDESESPNALPAVREREIVQIEASVFNYSEADGGHNDECAICLDGFEDGQKCRMMNKCGHIFHRICIDQWLKVEGHCPLCRRSCVCVVVRP